MDERELDALLARFGAGGARQRGAAAGLDDIDAELARLSREMGPGDDAAAIDDEVEALVRETMAAETAQQKKGAMAPAPPAEDVDAELEALVRRSSELLGARGAAAAKAGGTKSEVPPAASVERLRRALEQQTLPDNQSIEAPPPDYDHSVLDGADTGDGAVPDSASAHSQAQPVASQAPQLDGEVRPVNDIRDIVRAPARSPFAPGTRGSPPADARPGQPQSVVSAAVARVSSPLAEQQGTAPSSSESTPVHPQPAGDQPATDLPTQADDASSPPPHDQQQVEPPAAETSPLAQKAASPPATSASPPTQGSAPTPVSTQSDAAPRQIVVSESGMRLAHVASAEALGLAKMLRALLAQAQQCQAAARVFHGLGDSAAAAAWVRRQRALEADIAALRPAANRPDADALLRSQAAFSVRLPDVARAAAATNESVPEGVLRVSVPGDLPSGDLFVRVTCESQALDAGVPPQQDVPAGGHADWAGFVPDGIRASKFVEHRRVRVDVRRRGTPPAPKAKGGLLSSLRRLVHSSESEEEAPAGALNLDAVRDGSVLLASGTLRLAPLLDAAVLEAEVEMAAPRVDGQPKAAPILQTLRVRVATRRPMLSRAIIAELKSPQTERSDTWRVLVAGASGPALGAQYAAAPAAETKAPGVFFPLDTEDGVLCASYVVLEDEVASAQAGDPARAAVLQARLSALADAVDSGALTLEDYTAHVRTALGAAKRLAVERKRAGDAPGASAWLRRVRLMEGELREVGVSV